MNKNDNNEVLKQFLKLLNASTNKSSEIIYHYTSCDGLKGIIEERNMFFSDIYSLNDKSERFYFYRVLKEVFEDMHSNNELNDDFYNFLTVRTNAVLSDDYLEKESEIKFWRQYYTSSFSLGSDSLMLWNNYAKSNDHDGYNIGFRKSDILTGFQTSNKKDDVFYAGTVIYDKSKQISVIKSILAESNKLYEDKPHTQTEIGMALHTIALFFKHPGFSSEEEYRFILSPKAVFNNIDERLKYRINYGFLIPYLEINFDVSAIISVCSSPKLNSQIAKESLKMFLKAHKLKVKIMSSTIPLRY